MAGQLKFCITTLTCNNRATLIPTIRSFFENTTPPALTWFVLLQGCADSHVENVKKLCEEYEKLYPQVVFDLIISKENLGLSKGNNILVTYAQEYTYIANIEDDWYCLPQSITGLSKDWLITCLKFLDDNPHVSTLFLRKYVDAADKYKYAWTRDITYINHKHKNNFNASARMKGPPPSHTTYVDGIKFQEIPRFLFTFNPCIFRRKDYAMKGVFPFPSHDDVRKPDAAVKAGQTTDWSLTQEGAIKHWGWCEAMSMEKTRDLITYNVHSGTHGHMDEFRPVLKAKGIDC